MKRCLMAALLLALGCSSSKHSARAYCLLLDTSGTYADQQHEVVEIIKKGLLPHVRAGDSLFLARIDDASYERANMEARLHLDPRPSRANAQKLGFAQELDAFAGRARSARHTDISGGLMLCAEYLNESGARHKSVVLFSDLKEELPRGARRRFRDDEFKDVTIVAMNVKRLRQDNLDPAVYRERLDAWEEAARASGANEWRTVLDAERLAEALLGN